MIKSCDSKRMLNGGGKIGIANLLVAIFSLALVSCNSTDDAADTTASVPMTVQVSHSLFAGGSRALITDEYITSGSIGVTLVDGGGTKYDNVTYSNLQYTYSAGAWAPAGGVTTPPLTATAGKAAAYYPFVAGASVTAVPVTIAEQQDVLYSGWVSDISIAKPEANFHMQHALAAVRVVLKKDATYVPSATATEVSVTSDDFYPTATLDATLGDLTPTGDAGATVTTGAGSWAVTTGGTGVDLLVIPGGVAQKITFSATIGGKKYTATTPAAVTLGRALIHTYTLTLSAQGLTVGEVSVEPWGLGVTGSLTLEPYDPWKNIANGVYAVAANGTPVDAANADESCIAVALIVNDAPTPQKIMIEKNETENSVYNDNVSFYWNYNSTDLSIQNYTTVDGSNSYGTLLGSANGVSRIYSNWTSGALSDFDGKNNTPLIFAASTDAKDMGTVLNNFNAAIDQNQGFNDWYIPACGQLGIIFLYKTKINNILAEIGGVSLSEGVYWSSTEYNKTQSWYLNFKTGYLNDYKFSNTQSYRVRFIRDI